MVQVSPPKSETVSYAAQRLTMLVRPLDIPGKKIEPLNYTGGMVPYVDWLNKSLENNYQKWTISKG